MHEKPWPVGTDRSRAETLARGLGWFSIGLGVAEVVASGPLSRTTGVPHRPALLTALGAREIATGIGILRNPEDPRWMDARVAGDAIDLALLLSALGARDVRKTRVLAAATLVAGVTALDTICSRLLADSRLLENDISSAVTVRRGAEELFGMWRDPKTVPLFMKYVKSIRAEDGGRRWHWAASIPGGIPLEWDSEIVEEDAPRRLAWRSLEGMKVAQSGSVDFAPAPGERGTEVRLRVRGSVPGAIIREDLRRFKRLAETGEIPTTEGQPWGPSRVAPVTRTVRAIEKAV